MLEAIRRYFFRRRMARIISRYAHQCPTGRAFDAALQQARIDNAPFRRERRRAALRTLITGK